MRLSKSRYTQGVQCPKMVWMLDHMRDQFDDSVMNQAVLDQGSAVGDLAMGYYGSYVEVSFDSTDTDRFVKAAAETKLLLESGERTICEATFMIPGHYCMVDILRVRGDGSFDVVEVKSSTTMHPQYLDDMAYQCWLIQECGYRVASVSLMHIDNSYVRQGVLDLQKLFVVEDHTDKVMGMVDKVPETVARIEEIDECSDEPKWPIGLHCFSPYECGFRGWCFRGLPEHNVFELARLSKAKAFALVERGTPGFEDIIEDMEALELLNPNQQMQLLAEVENREPQINRTEVCRFLDGLTYPLYFLDFESFQEAIPSFDGARPYEQIVSQYSLHWLDSPRGMLHHAEFLGEAGTDPRRAVAESLIRDIPSGVCVLAWNMSFEKGIIMRLANLYPDLASQLMAIHDNVQDLMVPFRARHYYSKEMQGSCSIKKVLPALFPDDPQLDYHTLEGVHNGSEASAAFLDLAAMPPEEQEVIRNQLLRYCELDTLAMVRIWQKLMEICE